MNSRLTLTAALALTTLLGAKAGDTFADASAATPDSTAAATLRQVTPVSAQDISQMSAGKRIVLSLDECVRIALDGSPTVKVAEMEIERSELSRRETLAALLPTLDFNLNYNRSIELQSMKMNFEGNSQTIKMGTDNNWNMGFSAALPVVAPQLWKSLKLSDTQIEASVEEARASRLDLVNQVRCAYYALLLAKASQTTIRQNYDNAVFNASLYEKKFKVGAASEYDVLRSSVQVKNIEPELLQADIAIRRAKLQLCVLMGIRPIYDIDTDMQISDYQQEMFARSTSAPQYSLDDNTSMRSLIIQGKALKQTVDLKKLAWVPTLAATFNLNWSSMSNGNMFKNIDFNPYSNVGFTVSVPIFSGGSKWYSLKQSKVQLAENNLQREDLRNSLQMQVEMAVDNINMEARQISSSAEGVRQAKKAHDIMQKSFEIGAASYLDLRDAELAETSAQLVYYQAIYNYLVSNSELDLLLGRGLPENE